MAIPNLDDPREVERIDPNGMLDLVSRFPEQIERAVEPSETFQPTLKVDDLKQIVVSGLGSSGIIGDMICALLAQKVSLPITTNRDYHLPASVDSNSLVVAISYSGNTEEVLSAYSEARDVGAKLLCITSGGVLAERAEREEIDLIRIPNGLPARAAAGYMFIPLLLILEKLHITSGWKEHLPETVTLLRTKRDEYQQSVEQDDNRAKELARDFYTRIPVLYGGSGVAEVVANRWKEQINLNSKMHAFANAFPESNHNEIDAWEMANSQCESFAAVIIRDPEDMSRIADKIETTKTLIPKGFPLHDVPLEGENDLQKLLCGFLLGDYVSTYLAILNRVDPMVTTGVEALKEEAFVK